MILLPIAVAFLTSCFAQETKTSHPTTTPPKQKEPLVVKPATPTPPLPSQANAPDIVGKSAVVIDSITGRIIYQKSAREQRAVASTQKLLTALCVIRAGSLEDEVTIQSTDTNVVPAKIYIKSGEKYTRRALLKALIIKSGNDVAKALARDVSGDQGTFVKLMNTTAKSIGMKQSNFKNSHGLTAEGQYSTALDIAILARECQKIPSFRTWMKTKEYNFSYPNDRKDRKLINTNDLLKKLSYCTGMKTGSTKASGRCLVSSGTLNGRSVIAVVLGSTEKSIFKDSEALLKWALEPAKPDA